MEKLEKPQLKNITINLPDQYDEVIQKLITLKLIPSRSEAIRAALREFLLDEFRNLDIYNSFSGKPIKNSFIGPEMESNEKKGSAVDTALR